MLSGENNRLIRSQYTFPIQIIRKISCINVFTAINNIDSIIIPHLHILISTISPLFAGEFWVPQAKSTQVQAKYSIKNRSNICFYFSYTFSTLFYFIDSLLACGTNNLFALCVHIALIKMCRKWQELPGLVWDDARSRVINTRPVAESNQLCDTVHIVHI